MKYKLLFAYTVFFSFISQVTAWGAPTILKGVVDSPQELVCQPEGMIQSLGCFFSNMGIFFRMMTVSTEYAVISSLIISPFIIILVVIVIDWIIEIIPG